MVQFERGTKQRLWARPDRPAAGRGGLSRFRTAAAILDMELSGRNWLVGDAVSHADFRMASFLPFNDAARLPLGDYPNICRWNDRSRRSMPGRDPFRGLDAPELPPIPER